MASRQDKFMIQATDDPLELLDEVIKGARLQSFVFPISPRQPMKSWFLS